MPNKPTLTQKQKKAAALATLVLFILLSLAVFWFVGRPMVHFAKEPELFRQLCLRRRMGQYSVYAGSVFRQRCRLLAGAPPGSAHSGDLFPAGEAG